MFVPGFSRVLYSYLCYEWGSDVSGDSHFYDFGTRRVYFFSIIDIALMCLGLGPPPTARRHAIWYG